LKKDPLVLAIDVGTSSVRAILYDSRASELRATEAQLPYQPRVGAGGRAEVVVRDLTAMAGAALDPRLARAGAVRAVQLLADHAVEAGGL